MFDFVYNSIFILILAVMTGKNARYFPDNTDSKNLCNMLFNGLIITQVFYSIYFLLDILR